MHRNEPNEHLLNLRFNTYLLKYQLIHNRVGMN